MYAYLKEMHYSEPEAALFILGYLLSEVGRGQYSAGHKNKPVLEKLNYQGMAWPKVLQLANVLFEKLRHYDKLGHNERLYAQMKSLLDAHRKNRKKWELRPEENVFYILSGYAYGVRTWSARKTQNEED